MIVTIYTTDGGTLDITSFDAQTVLEMIADLQEAKPGHMLTFDLDEGLSQVFIQKRHIVRIDIDHEPRNWRDRVKVLRQRVTRDRWHPVRDDDPPYDFDGQRSG